MRTKALAWTLAATLCAAGASADEPKEKPGGHGSSAGEHLERAGKELDAAGRQAAKDANRAADDAKREAAQAARETREAAHEAKEAAKQAAKDAKEAAKQAASETGEAARELYEQGKEEARGVLDEARHHTRALLLNAAAALTPEEEARANQARGKRWGELRAKLKGQPDDPEAVNEPLRAELKQHSRRVARLTRIRELALENNDGASAARVDTLLSKENARHEVRVAALTASDSNKEATP